VTRRHRDQRGIVLPLVLIIGLLLSASIFTFTRRSLIDGMIVRNRDKAAAAEALASGGVQIAIAIVFQDQYLKLLEAFSEGTRAGAKLTDQWARVANSPLYVGTEGKLTLRIEDAGARLNLNALVPTGVTEAEAAASDEAEEFMVAFMEKILDELELKTEERIYDPREMAQNLLDYIDEDDVAINGRSEDEYYRNQDPPYTAANRPLLSVEEIAMIEGFDTQIADAMRPYVTVHPLLGEQGINVNTAPPHVLSVVYSGSSGDRQLSDEDIVRDIMQVREQEKIVCSQTESAPDICVGLSEAGLGFGGMYPEVDLPMEATVFLITSEARFGDVVRRVEAVVDISERETPRLLSWRAL